MQQSPFVIPVMSTAALAPFTRIAGAAAALMGFFQMGAGLLVSSLGALVGDTLIAMAVFIPMMGLAACLSYILHLRIRDDGPAAPATPGPRTAQAVMSPAIAMKNTP